MLVGAHVSIAGGIDRAISRGEELGATAIQTFASSPRKMQFVFPENNIIDSYLSQRAISQIKYHVFHGAYLINLAHEKEAYVRVCEEMLTNYQLLAKKIGVVGTVFHIGSHKGRGLEAVLPQVVQSIRRILDKTPDGVKLLIENAAGQKGTIGAKIEELAQITREVKQAGGPITKLGYGIDTQHAYASGYAIHTAGGLEKFVTLVEQNLGWQNVSLLHVNDSKVDCGSNRDRHENLGEGFIGMRNLKRIINHSSIEPIPKILEVPGVDKKGPGKKDVTRLKQLIE